MKPTTLIMVVKAVCYMLIGACTPMASSLTQWSNSGQLPSKLQWTGIIIGAITGGSTQLLAFLSGSYSDWVKARNGVDNAPNPVKVAP